MISVYSFRFDLFNENSYLIFNNLKQAALVDPGCYTEEEIDQIDEIIEYCGLRLNYVLNTHCHIDHTLGNFYFTTKYSVPLILHQKEYNILKRLPSYAKQIGLKYNNPTFELSFVKHGDSILIGNSSLNVIETPGHSPGSISFLSLNEGLLFSGDVIFRERIGKTNIPGSNYDTLVDTIEKRIFCLDEAIKIFPGHGPTTVIMEEKRNNKFKSGLF